MCLRKTVKRIRFVLNTAKKKTMARSQRLSVCVCLVVPVLNVFVFLIGGSGALRDVEIVLPRYVRRGDDVKLTCNFNQERDQIYAVNWYRTGERKKASEFYRFVPKEAPPQKAFHLPGFVVDVRRSSDHDVYLRNVSLDISGLYKCSVTAEHTFQTLSSTKEMTVVVIGEESPFIHLDRAQYHPGDSVTVECQSPYSFPPANITWFYNNIEVGPLAINKTEYLKSHTDPVTQSTLSRFYFELPTPEKGAVTVSVKCRVKLFTVYDQNSTVQTIAPIPWSLTGTDTLLRQGASTNSSSSLGTHQLSKILLLVFLTLFMTMLHMKETYLLSAKVFLQLPKSQYILTVSKPDAFPELHPKASYCTPVSHSKTSLHYFSSDSRLFFKLK